jgi:hypothetical protein
MRHTANALLTDKVLPVKVEAAVAENRCGKPTEKISVKLYILMLKVKLRTKVK